MVRNTTVYMMFAYFMRINHADKSAKVMKKVIKLKIKIQGMFFKNMLNI